jgi:hypothetical protein
MDNVPTFSEQPNREVSAPSGVTRLKPPVVAALVLYAPLKQCTKCKVSFPSRYPYFTKHKLCVGGVYTKCRWCKRAEDKAYQATPTAKERIRRYQHEWYFDPKNHERQKRKVKERLRDPDIAANVREQQREYRDRPENKQRRAEYLSDYYSRPEVRAHIRNQRREYLSRPEVRARQVAENARRRGDPEYLAYCRARYHRLKGDPQHRAVARIRCRLSKVVKRGDKKQRSMELVGCSRADLMVYLQSTMTPDMTVADFKAGRLHIDHIKPCASFDLTDPAQQKECFHFSNLQLLWAEDNFSKGAKDYEDWLALKEK